MAYLYTLDTPLTFGDLNRQVTVSTLKIVSISFNFEDAYASTGKAILSIRLADPVSGYPINVVYRDATALSLSQDAESQLGGVILNQLIADGKLPAGTLSHT